MQINLDNEFVGIVTRKDLAAPITSTGMNLKIQTSKRSTVLKGVQPTPVKKTSRGENEAIGQESDVPYEELRS